MLIPANEPSAYGIDAIGGETLLAGKFSADLFHPDVLDLNRRKSFFLGILMASLCGQLPF